MHYLPAPTGVKVLLSTARGRVGALYGLAVHGGLRMGELLGLRWGDVDLEAGKMRVVRQLQRTRGSEGLAFSPTKNASRRTIRLTGSAVEAPATSTRAIETHADELAMNLRCIISNQHEISQPARAHG